MLTTLKYRRHIAVLAALAMVASVLVAAPVVAADDPKPDYTATFSACDHDAVESSDFEDVPANHANAGDIDCIAYYTITKGTSATTYSPSMAVTREHMALFLTRLAALVGIEVTSTPDNPGFTDTSELSANSQTAIAQLADLGIAKGTSETTYSPADHVTRGQMALFISRLMNLMDPFEDDNDDNDAFAYIPSQVEDTDEMPVGSPFTDLGDTTKTAYDAITNLYELGVASGISATAYVPLAVITRATMAEFMAALLDHSNARPGGITVQVSNDTGFGTAGGTLAVSARDDSFAPMADVSIAIFTDDDSEFDDDGKCATDNVCDWSDSENPTGDSGNYFEEVSVVTGAGNEAAEETWYAWMGDEDNTEFNVNETAHATVTLLAKADALGIRISADVNANASNNTVNIGKDTTVVLTAQLIDDAGADADALEDAAAVAKEGVELTINWDQAGTDVFPAPDSMETDENGQVTFEVTGPVQDDDDETTQTRADMVSFTGDLDEGTVADAGTRQVTVNWTDVAAAVTTAMASVPDYTIIDDDEVSFRVTVSYYDQYGNGDAQNQTVTITVNNPDVSGDDGEDSGTVRVRSNGTASFRGDVDAGAGAEINITVTVLSGDGSSLTAAAADDVLAVRHAHKNDDGVSQAVTAYTDDDRFIIDTGPADTDVRGVLYSYDSGDTFIVDDKTADMAAFEEAIDKTGTTVDVVFYSVDGVSIFSATTS